MEQNTMFAEVSAMNGLSLDTMSRVELTPVVTEAVEVVDQNHFFDFEKAKVQSLTFEQLKRTVHENDGKEGKPLHGIYHFQLIQQILDICKEQGYEPEIYDMFATNNRDKQTPGVSLLPALEKKYGERTVEAHIIRRLFTNIRLRDFDTNEVTTNLAVSYTQKGIQVGIGRQVIICHNQCMLNKEHYVSDFTVHGLGGGKNGERRDLQGILDTIKSWIVDLRHIVEADDEKIERMKRVTMSPAQLFLMIGMLTAIRVKNDSSIKEIRTRPSDGIYPLNQAQICQFTESLLVTQHNRGKVTAWDVYNAATELYKPQSAEQTFILPQNLAMVTFLENNGLI